jgi:hypothetical protein
MKRIVGFGEVIDGKLVLRNRETFDAQLTQLKGAIEVTVEKARSRRSLNQNAYYWGVVLKLLSEHTGYEIEEMHEVLKVLFNQGNFGEVKFGKSTAKLSTIDFMAYLEQIQRWAAQELGVVIPDPNQEVSE